MSFQPEASVVAAVYQWRETKSISLPAILRTFRSQSRPIKVLLGSTQASSLCLYPLRRNWILHPVSRGIPVTGKGNVERRANFDPPIHRFHGLDVLEQVISICVRRKIRVLASLLFIVLWIFGISRMQIFFGALSSVIAILINFISNFPIFNEHRIGMSDSQDVQAIIACQWLGCTQSCPVTNRLPVVPGRIFADRLCVCGITHRIRYPCGSLLQSSPARAVKTRSVIHCDYRCTDLIYKVNEIAEVILGCVVTQLISTLPFGRFVGGPMVVICIGTAGIPQSRYT